ncbi:ICC-like putative phosphoesterase [Rhodopirellula maiorica SM1]|uniref:ICC-like putative phosphoesterase n=1 Tax=Rhodopirellula maiorica SM1 TaxID=1265738 RepID=M5RLK8_9BACT|nr:ligase-associated DNA damage response endonuclease PdeM [Rhodopirellula maiorica]EMI16262.1 ICC-like putative phosphoesterase [Rhodopirellula maiorica SM1]
MVQTMDVEIEGIELQLQADRTMFWPQQQTLFVADTHFGKAATFRRHGIPVPSGSTAGTLEKIETRLRETQANQLIILGDMFHARSSLSPKVCGLLKSFFARHEHVQFTLVRGNHDAQVGQLPSSWPIEVVEPGVQIESVALGHHPAPVPRGASLLLCGHLHPAVRFAVGGEDFGKLPCFWLSNRCFVLPAIGEFTGTHPIRPQRDDQTWMILDDATPSGSTETMLMHQRYR